MAEFHETRMGAMFFEGQVPELIRKLTELVAGCEMLEWRDSRGRPVAIRRDSIRCVRPVSMTGSKRTPDGVELVENETTVGFGEPECFIDVQGSYEAVLQAVRGKR